jgi:iron donor protein CyaY
MDADSPGSFTLIEVNGYSLRNLLLQIAKVLPLRSDATRSGRIVPPRDELARLLIALDLKRNLFHGPDLDYFTTRRSETLSYRFRPFMDDQEFQTCAGEALHDLYKRLNAASGSGEFEADFNAGALAIEFEEPPAKFVVSPNAPVRQIWVSAHSKSFKLDWNAARAEFVLAGTGESLAQMVSGAISQQLGQEVKL